jgi:RHS repeat-associated protein
VTEWAGYDYQNKLLWTNQAGNFPPASGQAAAYRLYQYDPNGQPVQIEKRSAGGGMVLDQLEWDGTRKLRRLLCQGQERYTAEYDSSGTRVRSRLYGVDHLYSYGAGLLHDEAGSTVYTPGVSQRRDGADAYFHQDWIGSTRYLTNSTGLSAPTAYRYDAYGRLSAQAGPDVTHSKSAGGHGYESDAPGGLQLLGARYYDPAVGRFLNPDPIGFLGGLNLYEYCFGNPVGLVDPSGLEVYGWGPEDAEALHQFNRQVNRWIGEQSGNITRALVSVVDNFGIADTYEAFTGDELFTPNRLSIPERAVTAVLAAVPCVPTNTARSVVNNTITWLEYWRRGRHGSVKTRLQIRRIATELENRGWTIVNGGERIPPYPEEYMPHPVTGRTGAVSPDITAVKDGRKLRINTVDVEASGRPTRRERRNAARIRSRAQPREHLLLIPKER